jgi:hypothetical protein
LLRRSTPKAGCGRLAITHYLSAHVIARRLCDEAISSLPRAEIASPKRLAMTYKEAH